MTRWKIRPLMLCGAFFTAAARAEEPAPKIQMRRGWFDNPTPGNASHFDRDGEWMIGMQGDYRAEGNWPEFSDAQ